MIRASNSFAALAALASLTHASVNITSTVVLPIPAREPPFTKLVDPSFVSMSFEFQFWPTYAGNATGQPNLYVNQLLNNLANRSGKPVAVRVGGELY